MTTFTIELDDELTKQLEERAAQTQMTPHEMAIIGLRDYLQNAAPTSSTRSETLSDDEFSKLARGVVEDYRVVLERLA